MRWVVCFFIFLSTSYAADLYEEHLPKKVCQFLTQQKFLGQEQLQNSVEKFYGAKPDIITTSIHRDKKGREYAVIDYWCGQVVDNFHGMHVVYQYKKLVAYAVFDGMGRDYVAEAPFSKKDQRQVTQNILNLLEGGYTKFSMD